MRGESNNDADEFEAAGREVETVYEAMFLEMDDAVFLVEVAETDDGYEFAFRQNNAAYQEQTGFSEDKMRGQTPRELLGEEQGAAVAANYRRCVERGTTIEYEERLEFPGGTTDWQTKLTPITEDGAITRIVGVARDVTEKKEREREYRRTHRRFQTVLETMSAAAFLKDTDGRYLLMNRACRDLFGADADPVGMTDEELFPRSVAERARADDLQVINGGETVEVEETIPTSAGETSRLTRKSPVYDGEGDVRAICGVSTDITEQKRHEEEIEATRKELRQIIDLVPDLVFVKNHDGEYLLANEATAEAYGKTPEEVEGNSEAEIIPSAEDSAAFRQDDIEVIESGEPKAVGEETLTTAAGETRILQTTKIPYRNPKTGEDAVLGYARDVTDLKAYEETLERQRDSLTLLNQVVRHDIRNQLMVVESYTELLEGSLPDDQSRTHARTVIEAAKQAREITETARDVTDVLLQVGADPSPMSLRDELSEQIAQLRSDQDRTTVSVDGSIPDVTVLADELLEAVFRNLLTNAVVHNDKDVAEIAVSTRVSDDSVRVSIADNGPGIADDHKGDIFQEGEKGLESGGTGVGLYLVKTLVDKYEGDIWVEDNEPTGSVFVVELSIVD
ncbi:PAS domain S-box protein [Halorubrum sp. BOL3-1]|uniref:PAS domain-containing protein n=1 Tax=Halorubrum sp. BOL3-1 TaxID=2497325 RepID=UPI0010051A5D|nr:PAS domain-containing protein [Halorubrum sp. BOL3-1]QAU13056.1 PAS domain S-box protein [Halorubrum sp. BOL3-1]